MQVILMERVVKLGQMGDVVDVKSGYARNYLLPQGKALTASKDNIAQFSDVTCVILMNDSHYHRYSLLCSLLNISL